MKNSITFTDAVGMYLVLPDQVRCRGDRREVCSFGIIHVMWGLVIGVMLVVVVVLSCRGPAVDSSDR